MPAGFFSSPLRWDGMGHVTLSSLRNASALARAITTRLTAVIASLPKFSDPVTADLKWQTALSPERLPGARLLLVHSSVGLLFRV